MDVLYPADLMYTAEHEWVQQLPAESGARFRIGITDFAQEALGDIVYVDLPAIGDQVTSGDPCGELESTKSVSELYAPITGTVVARNEALGDSPEVVNADPYGEGWLLDIEADTDEEAAALLDAETYQGIVKQQ